MTRLPLPSIEEQPEPIREFITRRGGLNVLRLLANAPNVFGGWGEMVDEIFASPTFSPRLREIVILRVAHLQDSPYELSQHRTLAKTAGLSEQEIEAAAGDLDDVGFSPTERTALAVVTELCTTHHLSDDSFAAAQAVFGDEALTELLMVISCYYGLALVLNAADVDIDTEARFRP
jgi:4-carboxymuconolactone decarboxylase